MVNGDGYISSESEFYGDDKEQDRLESLCQNARQASFWSNQSKDLNTILAEKRKLSRAQSSPDLHNIYQGQDNAWQLGESIDEFIDRLPPKTTSVSDIGPWIWVANPHRSGRDKSKQPQVEDKLIPLGRDLLQEAQTRRIKIRAKGGAGVSRTLMQEGKDLKKRLANLAKQSNVLTGKWMLFETANNVNEVWRSVAEETIGNRLGSAAKVATDEGTGSTRLICVYTKDFNDTDDVLRVLRELDDMGFVDRKKGIYYKADVYTHLDIFSNNAGDYGLQASMYSSNNLLR